MMDFFVTLYMFSFWLNKMNAKQIFPRPILLSRLLAAPVRRVGIQACEVTTRMICLVSLNFLMFEYEVIEIIVQK